MKFLKDFVRSRPALYDRVRRLKRGLAGSQEESFKILDRFSHDHGGRVNFIQIGANDGLRNDPLRPLIVRDDWQGVFVEPLPTVFPLLKRNYAYLNRPGLIFVNAAVTCAGAGNLPFWSLDPNYLATLPLEVRLDYQRKASFNRNHVLGFLPPDLEPEKVLQSTPVPCLGPGEILQRHLPRRPLHLLAIDVEGYEGTLIPGIDFSVVAPEAVFFEVEHLGADRQRVYDHLQRYGYRIANVGLDAFAVRQDG